MRSSFCLAVLLAALAVPSCKVPPPNTPVGHVIDCSKEALQECGSSAIAPVNTCLGGNDDVAACLMGLIQPAGCMTENLVACMTRHSGSEFNAAAQANQDDVRSLHAAERARAFIAQRGYVFVDDPGKGAGPSAPSVP